MKLIYHCFGGTHSSVLCAALHLGMITDQQLPDYGDLMDLPYFDKVPSTDVGNIFRMGQDEQENEVYILGCRNCGPMVEKTTREMNRLLGITQNEVVMVNTTSSLNITIKIGGYLSRRLGLTGIGRILLCRGIRRAFPNFIKLVHSVKQDLVHE